MFQPYTAKFFDSQKFDSKRSAIQIAPILLELLGPHSVVDVGCGAGVWLSTLKLLGVQQVFGIDGPWAKNQLEITSKEFHSFDFARGRVPFELHLPQKKYDLAISLEFFEHLDESIARDLVAFICSLADVVAFSAAVPGQGGLRHLNEQWPDYWVALFNEQEFVACDALRFALWNNAEVKPWYTQNIMLYFRGEVPNHVVMYANKCMLDAVSNPKSIVHPAILQQRNDLTSHPISNLLMACALKARRRFRKLISIDG